MKYIDNNDRNDTTTSITCLTTTGTLLANDLVADNMMTKYNLIIISLLTLSFC